MVGLIGLMIMILFLTTIMSAILFGTSIIEIMNSWKERRCEPYVIFTAPLYKKSTDERSATNFALDNLMFCIEHLSDDIMGEAFAPIYEILKGSFTTIAAITGLLTNFRGYFKTLMDQFEGIINTRFRKFITVFDLFRVGLVKLESAFGRINGVLIATLYQSMAGYVFIQNMVQAIVKIVIIMISILAAMVVFLFFVMFPVIPIILTTIGLITSAGLGAAVGSYTGAFCLDPSTSIVLSNNTTKPIKSIDLGTILLPSYKTYKYENIVYGILETDGSKTDMYSIDTIRMSGSHRVFENGSWVLAKNVKRSKPISYKSDRLFILNTTHHWVPAVSNSKILYVSDWEEVDTKKGQNAWLEFVANKLHAEVPESTPSSIPLLGKDIEVLTNGVKKPISSIRIGDKVHDENGETIVLGIYKGYLGNSIESTTWISDGNWIKVNNSWRLFLEGSKTASSFYYNDANTIGYQLITESGSFSINYSDFTLVIRDFTECGIKNIEECYEILDTVL